MALLKHPYAFQTERAQAISPVQLPETIAEPYSAGSEPGIWRKANSVSAVILCPTNHSSGQTTEFSQNRN